MSMQNDIERLLGRKLANEVSKKIDVKKLADQMAPTMERELKKQLLKAVTGFDMRDLIYEVLDRKFYKMLSQVMGRAVKKLK